MSRRRVLAKRYEIYEHAGAVPYQSWKDQGIKALFIDKDGTLTDYLGMRLFDNVRVGMLRQRIHMIFPKIVLGSNTDNPGPVRRFAAMMEDTVGSSVIPLTEADGYRGKPNEDMGIAAARILGIEPNELGIVGDRRFTDVGLGYNIDAGAIALCRKQGEGDNTAVRIFWRRFEHVVVAAEHLMGIAVDGPVG